MITLLNKFDDNYIIHEEDILDIISQYIKAYDLEQFIKDVNFDNNLSVLASYNCSNLTININMKRLWETCYKWSNKLQSLYKIDNSNYSYLLNYYCLYILFHEITHANQKKQHDLLIKNTDSMYIFLYELNEKLQLENKDLYNKHHDLFPMEIEANNTGLLNSYNLMSHTKLPSKEKRILHLQYVRSLLSNYEKINKFHINTPFNKLASIDKRINLDLYNELLNESRLNKIERLNLGLDITPHEYNSLQREKIRLLIKR